MKSFSDWEGYVKAAEAHFKSRLGKTDIETLLNASWALYHLDKSHDKQVLAWTNKAMNLVPSNSGPYFLQGFYLYVNRIMKRLKK